jgi:hypothetical protein
LASKGCRCRALFEANYDLLTITHWQRWQTVFVWRFEGLGEGCCALAAIDALVDIARDQHVRVTGGFAHRFDVDPRWLPSTCEFGELISTDRRARGNRTGGVDECQRSSSQGLAQIWHALCALADK